MVDVALQIVFWILAAAALGFAIGWMARGRRGTTTKKRRRF